MNPEQSVTKKHQEQLTLASKVRKRATELELRELKRSEKWYNILFKADYFNPEYSIEERHLVQISKLSDENIWEIESESSLEKRMLCAEQYLPKPFICGTPFMQETYIETYIDYEDRNGEAPKEVKQGNEKLSKPLNVTSKSLILESFSPAVLLKALSACVLASSTALSTALALSLSALFETSWTCCSNSLSRTCLKISE